MMRSRNDASVFFVSLGCPKNRVDTERMASILEAQGYRVTGSADEADVIVVNTCAFIEPAVEESLDTIVELAQLREQGPCRRLVVAGCLFTRYGEELKGNLPEVDLFVGTDEFHCIGSRLRDLDGRSPDQEPGRTQELPRFLSTPFYTAYLKIAEGCDNRCSYCLIPRLRGPYRSVPPEDLRAEASALSARGVTELNVVAQDTTAYGRDLRQGYGLDRLLSDLAEIPGLRWIRTLYLYPERVDEPLLNVIRAHERLLPYFDLPVQHVSAKLLQRMGRRTGAGNPRRVIERIRSRIPDAAIRLTLMVGFPGEGDREFEELMDFVRDVRPEHLGAFRFYAEAGIRAARLSNRVPKHVQEERLDALMRLQAGLCLERNRSRVGSEVQVLVEGPSEEVPGRLEGRVWWQAPEIDGMVLFKSRARAGDWVRVRITEARPYDLMGRMVSREDETTGG